MWYALPQLRQVRYSLNAVAFLSVLAEVQTLRERGCTQQDQAMQAIGYRHLLAHLEGQVSHEDTVRLIKRDTRRFAKRQLTWFGGQARSDSTADGQARSGIASRRAGLQPQMIAFEWLQWATSEHFDACVKHVVEAAKRLNKP